MHRAAPKVAPPNRQLIDALCAPGAFDHPVTSIELIETHISWVILTDEYAYKIKKPLSLGFLDFSDLERRKFFCAEEIRLNKPSAPEIYLDVVPISNGAQPRVGGDGQVIEYAVKMRRFDQDLRLDVQLADNKLSPADMKELGQVIAKRHKASERVAVEQREHQLKITRDFIWDNFTWLEGTLDNEQLASLSAWTKLELEKLEALLGERFDAGFVRDCHGDLHLANLVRLPTGITTFDCIEFNADLRHMDVVCDIAFLVMDLVARERHDLAAGFLNRYLECTGDYAGVALLDLYFVYRCLVRAKVAAIGSKECTDETSRDGQLAEVRRYCAIAERQARKTSPLLVVMRGLSGSGKTWLSEQLLATLPAIRVRSDIERKRLFGLDEQADSESGVAAGIYANAANESVYALLCAHARLLLESGHNAILDAAFLQRAERDKALRAASDCGCAAVIVQVNAPLDTLRSRILQRAKARQDASEASLAVLEHQLRNSEPLTDKERKQTIICENTGHVDVTTVARAIKARR